MILLRKNYEVDDDLVDLVKTQIKENKNTFDQLSKLYTTYFAEASERPEVIFLDFYSDILESITKELSIYHRSNYTFPFWVQIYTPKSRKFEEHDHFSGKEIVSWVHFLSQSSKKCFYFIDSDGNKTYPEQNKGDFIVFPSWVLHAAEPPENEERIVISGNVALSKIQTQIDDFKYSECSYYSVDGKRMGIWDISINKFPTKGKKGFRTSI